MAKCDVIFPIPLPDDPRKWDGWSNFDSPNYYERLCLDPRANPSNELIEEHCRELLRWWQKKLPLKNQPSNPLAQMLRGGLDDSSRYLTEARVELLDPERRRKVDEQLADERANAALEEFKKYLGFATADGSLSADEESNLIRFGLESGLSREKISSVIDEELAAKRVERVASTPPSADSIAAPSKTSGKQDAAEPGGEFKRLLWLSGLDSDSMTDDQRDALINMAENLGMDPGEAEDMVDVYLDEADAKSLAAIVGPGALRAQNSVKVVKESRPAENNPAEIPQIILNPQLERSRNPNFNSSLNFEMMLVPSGEFLMGSEDAEAAPNERPVTKVHVTCFYMSRHLITNADYENFDPGHIRKRMRGADFDHPVVYVSSDDALKFCDWLSARERRKYRLPTEAEWEYAARGSDGRPYPWGQHTGRGDLGNFADRNTDFAWSDPDVDDGFAETSPVGSFPFGASPFGIEDMAGNVWEWCLDYFAPYQGMPRFNPRGPANGARRVYRGGSWKSRFNSLRATVRQTNAPNYSCNDLGFRVVCECAPH